MGMLVHKNRNQQAIWIAKIILQALWNFAKVDSSNNKSPLMTNVPCSMLQPRLLARSRSGLTAWTAARVCPAGSSWSSSGSATSCPWSGDRFCPFYFTAKMSIGVFRNHGWNLKFRILLIFHTGSNCHQQIFILCVMWKWFIQSLN